MTTNEIMANLEAMSKTIEDNLIVLEASREITNDLPGSPKSDKAREVLTARIDDLKSFKSWLDDLQEKHWMQESQMEEATMFLNMIK